MHPMTQPRLERRVGTLHSRSACGRALQVRDPQPPHRRGPGQVRSLRPGGSSCARARRPVPVQRPHMLARTATGWSAALPGTGCTRRSTSTKCTRARGGATRTGASTPTTSWPPRSSPMSRRWATRTSSCCRFPNIRWTNRGATRPPAISRRPAATANPTGCGVSSMRATRQHRCHPGLGAGALPDRRLGARALRRHRALRARRPAPRGCTRTGARTSSTSAATRSRAFCSRARTTGCRSSTSTACASTRSPRCSISTTRARRASGSPTATAAAKTWKPSTFLRELNVMVHEQFPGALTSPRSRPRGRWCRGRSIWAVSASP